MNTDEIKEMDEMKPCPFCKGKAIIDYEGPKQWSVQCRDCAVSVTWYDSEAEALAAWNTRASAWIKVEDGLPKKSGKVWFSYIKTGYTYSGHYDAEYDIWAIFDPHGGYSRVHHKSPPTHWQEITLPKG